MKVSKTGGANGVSSTKKKKPTSGSNGAFAEALGNVQTSDSVPVSEGAAVGNVDGVFAVQAIPDAMDGRSRRELTQFGDDVLDDLDQLRLGILNGAFSKDKLAALAHKLRQKRQTSDDSALNSIIQEIELRAEVEIAKLTKNL